MIKNFIKLTILGFELAKGKKFLCHYRISVLELQEFPEYK